MLKGNDVEMTPEEWEQFYESQGSRFFQLESATLKAHGDDQKKLFYEIFGSTTKLVQVIGVVAGFGFTGLGYVRNHSLFLLGEACLLAAIFVGLWWTQKIYRSNLAGSDSEVTRIKSLFRNRYSSFKKIYDKALADIEKGENTIKVPASEVRGLQKKNNELMEHFGDQTPSEEGSDMLPLIMILFAAGAVMLLLSFLRFYSR